MHRFLTQRQLRRKFFLNLPAEPLRAPAVCRAFDHTSKFHGSSKFSELSISAQRARPSIYM